MVELTLLLSHPDEPSPGEVTLFIRQPFSEKIVALLEEIEPNGAGVEVAVPADALKVVKVSDSWAAVIESQRNIKLALTKHRFTLLGTHPYSVQKWHSTSGWVEDLVPCLNG